MDAVRVNELLNFLKVYFHRKPQGKVKSNLERRLVMLENSGNKNTEKNGVIIAVLGCEGCYPRVFIMELRLLNFQQVYFTNSFYIVKSREEN